ncbi:hypothetical protein ES703_13457 [subsurface metagenome]
MRMNIYQKQEWEVWDDETSFATFLIKGQEKNDRNHMGSLHFFHQARLVIRRSYEEQLRIK